MKAKQKSVSVIFLSSLCALGLTLSPGVSAAPGGGMDTGGGDLTAIRKARLGQMLSVAKTELLGWSAAVKQESFPDPQVRQLFARILGEGLRSDIQSSHYELKNRCFYTTPQGGELESSASARIGDRGGAICLNPEAILAAGATDADVYALLLHEHAHHLGYQEQEAEAIGNALGDYVAAYFYTRGGPSRPRAYLPPTLDRIERGRCLNLPEWFRYVQTLDPKTPFWEASTDFQVSPNPSDWFLYALKPGVSLNQGTIQDRGLDNTNGFVQQVGCEKLLFASTSCSVSSGSDGTSEPEECETQYKEAPIVESSATHLVYEAGDSMVIEGVPMRAFRAGFSVPDGIRGRRILSTGQVIVAFERRCKGERKWTRETRVMEPSMEMRVGESIPESLPVSTRLIQAIQRAENYGRSEEAKTCKIRPVHVSN